MNSKKDELKNEFLEERIKRRKDNIAQVLYTKRKIHQMQFQPFQDIIKKYPAPEVLKDIQKGLIQDIQTDSDGRRKSTRSDREETLHRSRPVSEKVQKKIQEKMLALQVSQPPESQLS